jgi:hypothetical protein
MSSDVQQQSRTTRSREAEFLLLELGGVALIKCKFGGQCTGLALLQHGGYLRMYNGGDSGNIGGATIFRWIS